MSQPIADGDYVSRTRPPRSYRSQWDSVIYQVQRLVRANQVTWAQVMKCNSRTLTVVPGSKVLRMPVDRLYRVDPLEIMARWGRSPSEPD